MNKKKQYVTLKDIARMAKVSYPTVSRVVNNKKYVKKETRDNIKAIIDELGYKPEWTARSLRRRKTDMIGVILPDISNTFFSDVVISTQNIFKKNNIDIIMFNSNYDVKMETDFLKVAVSKRVDGIIIAPIISKNSKLIKTILEDNMIPVVLIDNKVRGAKIDGVFHENRRGAKLLTEHLISHGHKRIGFLTTSLEESSSFNRLYGYKKALNENGLRFDEDLTAIINWNRDKREFYKEISNKVDRFFKYKNKPTAIFTASTNLAIGVMLYLNKRNYSIPEDVALVSFDDYDFVEVLNPPLTTLKGVNEKIGITAAKMLLEKIKKGYTNNMKELNIPAELNIRKSCGC